MTTQNETQAPVVVPALIADEKPGADVDVASSTAGLSDEEKKIIERQTEVPNNKVGYFSLFKYANKTEAIIMVVSFVSSIAAGACMPLMTVSFSLSIYRIDRD